MSVKKTYELDFYNKGKVKLVVEDVSKIANIITYEYNLEVVDANLTLDQLKEVRKMIGIAIGDRP